MSFTSDKIDILLAAYNGAPYIRLQIDSIIVQTHANWRLIIRDDNSGDNTSRIIDEYAKEYPEKITVLNNNGKNLGVVKNFEELLNNSTADYVCFCDQDDIWLPFKLESTLKKMKETESSCPDKAVLVHSDMIVVNEKLENISDSFFKYQNIDPEIKNLNRLLVQNNVTGCTTMINKKLKDLILPFRENIIMHDWYTALVAASSGIIEYIPRATVLYRQHSGNQLGAVKYGIRYIVEKILTVFERDSLINGQKQAALIKHPVATIYAALNNCNWLKRRYYTIKYGFFKKGFLRNAGLFLKI
ncbi:MAG: glycosyltransferase family 2 protein [Oligoflexia bacterium]|nr:glycosyltransferase family 2 protein [Oligoflexia bacterium]